MIICILKKIPFDNIELDRKDYNSDIDIGLLLFKSFIAVQVTISLRYVIKNTLAFQFLMYFDKMKNKIKNSIINYINGILSDEKKELMN